MPYSEANVLGYPHPLVYSTGYGRLSIRSVENHRDKSDAQAKPHGEGEFVTIRSAKVRAIEQSTEGAESEGVLLPTSCSEP